MKMPLAVLALLCVLFLAAGTCHPTQAQAPDEPGGTLLEFDFNTPHAWRAQAVASPGTAVTVQEGAFGTIDTPNTSQPSGGLSLTARPLHGNTLPANWSAALLSGVIPVQSREMDAKKLTLSFQLAASSVRTVTVQVESYDARRKRTGGMTAQVFPAAPHFYQRYALDLSDMKSFGAGRFRPNDPFVQFRFVASSLPETDRLPADLAFQLQVDDVNYAGPAYYVRPQGNDSSDGRTEATAFATPQKGLDMAQPGDIVVLMDGMYMANLAPVADFPRAGTPAAWIVLKNYPGQHPTLSSNGWNTVSVAKGYGGHPSSNPALAYLEIRGLHLRGEGDVVKQKYPEAVGKSDPRSNSNGISVDGRYMTNRPHHIRIADNFVEYCPGCGIGAGESDWVTIENNVSRNNSWTTIYATSGISVAGTYNFDTTDNAYKKLIRNNICSGNQTFQSWSEIGHISDGNGIILDVNQGEDTHQGPVANPATPYIGRTLVQSNLSFNNGGSGIHAFRADHVDIIGNTAYLNSASPALQYGEIFAGSAHDVRIANNILVAPVANMAAGEAAEPVNGNYDCTQVVYAHNLYFGGNTAPVMGIGDIIADPQFVNAGIDALAADFHLKAGSPAVGKGVLLDYGPFLDLDGKPRHVPPTLGAYQH